MKKWFSIVPGGAESKPTEKCMCGFDLKTAEPKNAVTTKEGTFARCPNCGWLYQIKEEA